MSILVAYQSVKGSIYVHPTGHRNLRPTRRSEEVSVTLLLRRKVGRAEGIAAEASSQPTPDAFASQWGADLSELAEVVTTFAKAGGVAGPANLGRPVGFSTHLVEACRRRSSGTSAARPGPANNSFGPVKGCDGGHGWDPCSGLGSMGGQALQPVLAARRIG